MNDDNAAEWLYFDVVIIGPIWWIDGGCCAEAVFNRPAVAANDDGPAPHRG